jgi:putative tricarboxylic transport membrane protein
MGKVDRVVGIVVTGLGVAVAIGARRLPAEAEFGLGAAFLPFWLGMLLAVLGLGLLLGIGGRPPDEGPPIWPTDAPAWRRLGGVLVLLAGYVALLERIGYVATTFLFLLLSMMALERGRWWVTVLISGLSTGALVSIFRAWLKAPLPRGPWGF